MADIGEGISEVELIQWFVKEGDQVEEFSKICEVQSDKAAVDISSRYTGKVVKLYHEVGDVAKVGSPLVDIDTVDEEGEEVADVVEKEIIQQIKVEEVLVIPMKEEELIFAAPAVRRIAKENNLDIALITGSGPQGRVLKGDILAYIKAASEIKVEAITAVKITKVEVARTVMPFKPVVGERVEALTMIQKAMFKAMTKSLTIPHFGFSDEIILNETTRWRKEINQHLQNEQLTKISYMPIFLKTMSECLKHFPLLNAKVMVDEAGSPSLLYRSQHNIGVAMDTPQGLVVPNVKNVELKSILEIAADLEVLKIKAGLGQLSSLDLKDGTITLSNVGNIGGLGLHPVIVTNEVCIGSLGKIQRLPRYKTIDGVEVVVPTEVLTASFNADHRVVDGATMARFVKKWKGYLENPSLVTMDLK